MYVSVGKTLSYEINHRELPSLGTFCLSLLRVKSREGWGEWWGEWLRRYCKQHIQQLPGAHSATVYFYFKYHVYFSIMFPNH